MPEKRKPHESLREMFSDSVRYENFGNVLLQMRVAGFRCHVDTVIDFEGPITAFCGLNGTGKSTLLQLAAVAYRSATADSGAYTIGNFMIVSPLDSTPFRSDAFIEYKYAQADELLSNSKMNQPSRLRRSFSRTMSRNSNRAQWNGYRNRPLRSVTYVGIAGYLPRIEQRDLMFRHARHLNIMQKQEVVSKVRTTACGILTAGYEKVIINNVVYPTRSGTFLGQVVTSVERQGIAYSEAHMGYGEARVLSLINTLETIPERSLVLIEEPETALHLSAQLALCDYMLDVCRRRRHQILLTTHSDTILEGLPEESRVLLKRTSSGIETIPRVPPAQARSILAEGQLKTVDVLVEDECAKVILTELVRLIDADFLSALHVESAGGADAIRAAMRLIAGKKLGTPIVAVLDGDKQGPQNSDSNIFTLPGKSAPERELFENEAVRQHIGEVYHVVIDDIIYGIDHHLWLRRLASRLSLDEQSLMRELARIYATSIGSSAYVLVQLLKEACKS